MDNSPALKQRAHYESVHDLYAEHYYDSASLEFRRRFILAPLCKGIDLNERMVADLACGDGYNSLLLREFFPSVVTIGFDISEKACACYKQNVGTDARIKDLTVSSGDDAVFDAAVVVGGLHHCVSDLPAAMASISGMLRAGGLLLVYEPNSRFIGNGIRNAWYRYDRFFEADTERALSPNEILAASGGAFDLRRQFYCGGPAYFLVFNSMIFRIPRRLKASMAEPLMAAERAWQSVMPKRMMAAFGALFQKRLD